MFEQGVLIADRYKLISLLGRGGFSEVWLAEDLMANIKIAIKIYAPGVGLDDAGISLFTQEFSLVFDMNHTNLLHPTHFDCWQRMPFLILPYCQNGSAFKFVSPGMQISEEEAWKVLHDVASGLAYLHGKNPPIIHQDIKPDNILISDEGRYMITDFGISARVRSTLNRSSSEMSGGTLAYMGPERFGQNPQPIMASDIWSLGAMMYEMMTETPPYGNHGGMLQKNGADIPLIDGNYSQKLKNLVYRCVALKPWERPTAEQIERETNEYLLGGIIPPPPSPPSKFKKWGVAGGILAVVAILALLLLGNREEHPDVQKPDIPKTNYDSIYNVHVAEGNRLYEEVKFLIDSMKYDNDVLEATLFDAYDAYLDALESKKEEGASEFGLAQESLSKRMIHIDSVLYRVIDYCEEKKELMLSKGLEQYVPAFEERIQNINEFINERNAQ